MADFSSTATVEVGADALFDYLSDVRNLPKYFARMTSAEPGEGEEVHTTAQLPDCSIVEGDAWFRSDADLRTLTWGAEGPNAYQGSLSVSDDDHPDREGCRVAVHLQTTRVSDGDTEVQQGLDDTLAEIKQIAEDGDELARHAEEQTKTADDTDRGDPED